jgi:hypothetical protein
MYPTRIFGPKKNNFNSQNTPFISKRTEPNTDWKDEE